MNRILEIIRHFSSIPSVSGRKDAITHEFFAEISPIFKQAITDSAGNIILKIESRNPNAKNLILEAHRDVIGLCVQEITKEGFLSVCACGGIDAQILAGTEFTVFGKEKIPAIATSIPPHLTKKEDKNEKNDSTVLYLDAGFQSKKEVENCLSIGDVALFATAPMLIGKDQICGAGLDNAASMAALILAAEKLFDSNPPCNLYFSFTVGEETSSNGVRALAEGISADACLVFDVGFAQTPGLDASNCIIMGEGSSVSFTDTLSRKMTLWVKETAKDHAFPLQYISEAGGTGTSATALSVQNGGIPSAVISIPLKNMHSPSEIVSISDIQKTSELIYLLAQKSDFPSEEVILEK